MRLVKYITVFQRLFVALMMVLVSAQAFNPKVFADTVSQIDQVSAQLDQTRSCAFPESDDRLLSYAAEDAVWPELQDAPKALPNPIAAGFYQLTALSYDNHSQKNDPTQPNEQWQIWVYGADTTTPIYYSAYTDDIPDDQDETTTVLSDSVYFSETARYVRYVHYAYSKGLEINNFGGKRFDDLTSDEKKQVKWNSVAPICVDATPVTTPVCSAVTANKNTTLTNAYDFSVVLTQAVVQPTSVIYDFGNGTTTQASTSATVTRQYALSGQYVVSAKVLYDTTVLSTCQTTVTVAAAAVGGATVLSASTVSSGK